MRGRGCCRARRALSTAISPPPWWRFWAEGSRSGARAGLARGRTAALREDGQSAPQASAAAVVEVEVRQRRARDLGGDVGREGRVADPRGEVVERHDPGELAVRQDRQAADAVADHELRRVLDVHPGLAGDDRRRGVVGGGRVAPVAVGEDADREVAVGDEGGGLAVVVEQDDRADVALAHELGDLADRRVRGGGDHRLGHDLADLHGPRTLDQARRKMPAVAPPSPTQLAWRRRIEAALRVAAPALDLVLAAGDRFSRVVARGEDELESLAPGQPAPVPPGRRVGPGATATEKPPMAEPADRAAAPDDDPLAWEAENAP